MAGDQADRAVVIATPPGRASAGSTSSGTSWRSGATTSRQKTSRPASSATRSWSPRQRHSTEHRKADGGARGVDEDVDELAVAVGQRHLHQLYQRPRELPPAPAPGSHGRASTLQPAERDPEQEPQQRVGGEVSRRRREIVVPARDDVTRRAASGAPRSPRSRRPTPRRRPARPERAASLLAPPAAGSERLVAPLHERDHRARRGRAMRASPAAAT